MQKTRQFEYSESGFSARVVVRRATTLDGIVRGALINEAMEQRSDDPGDDLHAGALQTVRLVVWPALRAATVEADIVDGDEPLAWPLSLEQIADLPIGCVDAWMDAIYEVNPAWQSHPPQADEKKS